ASRTVGESSDSPAAGTGDDRVDAGGHRYIAGSRGHGIATDKPAVLGKYAILAPADVAGLADREAPVVRGAGDLSEDAACRAALTGHVGVATDQDVAARAIDRRRNAVAGQALHRATRSDGDLADAALRNRDAARAPR